MIVVCPVSLPSDFFFFFFGSLKYVSLSRQVMNFLVNSFEFYNDINPIVYSDKTLFLSHNFGI